MSCGALEAGLVLQAAVGLEDWKQMLASAQNEDEPHLSAMMLAVDGLQEYSTRKSHALFEGMVRRNSGDWTAVDAVEVKSAVEAVTGEVPLSGVDQQGYLALEVLQ